MNDEIKNKKFRELKTDYFRSYNKDKLEIVKLRLKYGLIGKAVYHELLQILSQSHNEMILDYDNLYKLIFSNEDRWKKQKNYDMLKFIIENSGLFTIHNNILMNDDLTKEFNYRISRMNNKLNKSSEEKIPEINQEEFFNESKEEPLYNNSGLQVDKIKVKNKSKRKVSKDEIVELLQTRSTNAVLNTDYDDMFDNKDTEDVLDNKINN